MSEANQTYYDQRYDLWVRNYKLINYFKILIFNKKKVFF